VTKRRQRLDSRKALEPVEERRGSLIWAVAAAIVMIAIVGVTFYVLQFATDAIIGTDGYFHIKYSYLMSHGHGLIRKLPWVYYTIHRDFYRDHHFLQHVLYIPFTFGDLRLGAKVGAWLFATLAMAVFYLMAARRGKITAMILTAILLGSARIFIVRMMMPRVASMSMIALLLAMHTIMTRRYRWLAVIMFGYVWLYDGFILAIFAMLCFLVAELLVTRRWNWRLLGWCLGGTVAGILINPYFPHNISSYFFNFARAFTSAQLIKGTGWEWRPYDTWSLLRGGKAVWLAFATGLVMVALCRRTRRETMGLLLMALFTTALLMKARRYVEIWPAMVLLFVAHAWWDFWEERAEDSPERSRRWRLAATAALAGLIVFTPFVCHAEWQKARKERAFEYYKGAAEFLKKHTEPKTIVFNADWDDFPGLFFFNSHNYYIVGLDQLYMARYDRDLFDLWRAICEGKEANPSKLIREKFGAEYAVVDAAGKQRVGFMLRAITDRKMRTVFEDRYCTVYRIVP